MYVLWKFQNTKMIFVILIHIFIFDSIRIIFSHVSNKIRREIGRPNKKSFNLNFKGTNLSNFKKLLLFDLLWLSQFNPLFFIPKVKFIYPFFFICEKNIVPTDNFFSIADIELDVFQHIYWIMSDAKTTKNAYFQITNEKGRDVHTEFLYMLDRMDEENKL